MLEKGTKGEAGGADNPLCGSHRAGALGEAPPARGYDSIIYVRKKKLNFIYLYIKLTN